MGDDSGVLRNLTALGNVQIGEDHILCKLNPKIYPLETVYSAAYILMDKAYILLDGDPEKEIIVEIRKKKVDIEYGLVELAQLFNEELLNYSVYKVQSERNKVMRETILQKVLLTNAPEAVLEKVKGVQSGSDGGSAVGEVLGASAGSVAEEKKELGEKEGDGKNNSTESEVLPTGSH